MPKLPPPPKFGGPDLAQGPKTIADWVSFGKYLWLNWLKLDSAPTVPEAEAFVPPSAGPGLDAAVSAALGIVDNGALGIQGAIDTAVRRAMDAYVALQEAPINQPAGAIAAYMLAFQEPPYPTRGVKSFGQVLTGTHSDRYSLGTGTVTGSALASTSGPSFKASWVGSSIAILGALFTITTWTDATHISVSGTPPAGAVTWEFMLYPANTVPPMSAFLETDRKVNYAVGDAAGTADVVNAVLSWVSGPKFSPYWAGTTIVVAGSPYAVSTATQISLTLATSTGITAAGQTWSNTNSSWYYQDGVEETTAADLISRLTDFSILDHLYKVHFYDYNHQIVYDGTTNLWTWDGEGSCQIVASNNTHAPDGGPWGFCDGSSYNCFELISGGSRAITGIPTIVSEATPNLTGDVFIRGAAYTGTVNPGTNPSFSASGATFSGTPHVLTGTNSAPAFTGTPGTPTGAFAGAALGTHAHDSPVGDVNATTAFITGAFGTGSTQTRSLDFTVGTGAGSAAVLKTSAISAGTPAGTITMDPFTPAGSVAAPTLTMDSYTPAGSISGGGGTISILTVGVGAPKSIALQYYMRR